MRILVLIVIGFTALSCNTSKNKVNKTSIYENTGKHEKPYAPISSKKESVVNYKDTLSNRYYLFQGVWAENPNENAYFLIKDDSLYYLEAQNEPMFYNIKGDTIVLNGKVISNLIIERLTEDSLWVKSSLFDGTIKLYKRK